jgi:CBS domain-containing protein
MTERAVTKIPVRLRIVIAPDAGPLVAPMVHCPNRGGSIETSECAACPHISMMTWDLQAGGDLSCTAARRSSRPAPRMDLAEAGARRPIHEVIRPVTLCVAAETPIADARRLLLERNVRVLPVVDSALRVVGILSRSDLMGGPNHVRVSEIMTPRVHTIEEHAPVAHAIALMAAEDISEVPVVTHDGQIVGVWHALDAMRWTAEQLGYSFSGDRPANGTGLRAGDDATDAIAELSSPSEAYMHS